MEQVDQNQHTAMEDPPHHMRTGSYGPRSSRKKQLIIVSIVVLVLAAAGAGAYVLFGPKKSSPPAKTSQSQNTQNGASSHMSESEASTPKTYKSTKLNIEFTYRNDWTMRESSDKSEVILTSPTVTYQTKSGGSKQGVFTLKMRNGLVPDAMKPAIENAVATRDSEVIAYSAPTDQQRQYTNISFGGAAADTTNFVIVSGSVAFKAGESFGSNIDLQGAVYLFAGGYGTDPNDTLAFDAVPKAAFETFDVYKQAVAIVESLKIY